MKTIILSHFFLYSLSFYSQTNEITLPIIKNGRWYLFNKSKEIELPKSYTYVNLFDKKGTAYFIEGNNYGVIDQNGKELIKSIYKDIEQFGNGIYRYSIPDGYELKSVNSTLAIKCSWSNQLNENWLIYKKDSSDYILNFIANKEIRLSKKSYLYHHAFNYVILKNDTTDFEIYDNEGVLLDKSKAEILIDQFYLYYKGEKEHFICDRNGKWDFPETASNVLFNINYFQYKIDSTCYLISRESKSLIIKANCDEIEQFENYYLLRKGNLEGLMDQKGKLLIPVVYSAIYKSGKMYHVRNKQAMGLLSENFKVLIPCEYSGFYSDSTYYHTYSVFGNGLISAETYIEILKPVYSKIEIKEPIIRAWSNNRLFIFELNKDQTIKNKIIIENVITITTRIPNFNPLNFDFRLLEIGWFYDTLSIYNDKGIWAKTAYKWGLKTESDSIFVPAKLNLPIYINKTNFSLLPSGKTTSFLVHKIHGEGKDKDRYTFPCYKMINYTTGKTNRSYKIIQMDTNDYLTHSFARFIHESGSGFIFMNGQVINASYVESKDFEFIRYCNSKDFSISSANEIESVCINSYTLKNSNVNFRYPYGYVKFYESNWNFLDKNGDSLFEKPFKYVQNFYKKTSIVRSENGWGVIKKDSVIIPTIYTSIERVPQFSDTVFKVAITPKGSYLLDSSLTILPFNDLTFLKSNESHSLFSCKNGFKVLNSTNQIIFNTDKNVNLKTNEFMTFKEKKEFIVMNSKGEEVCKTKSNPINFLNKHHFIIENKGKWGVISTELDTVIPINYEKIEKIGSKIIALGKENKVIYTQEFQVLKKITVGDVFIDSTSGYWSIQNYKSMTIYDENNRKCFKWKTDTKFTSFFQHYFFSEDGSVYKMDGTQITELELFIDVHFFKDNYCALQDKNKRWHLYNSNWLELTNKELKNKNITYHGDHVFSMQNTNGFMIYDYLNNKEYDHLTSFQGNFSDRYILAEANGKYFYLNRKFVDVFNRKFSNASEFKNGFACVNDERGWTIIGKDGYSKSLNSYPKINQIGTKLFQTSKQPLYGFIDSNGTIIIDPIFEKLTILENGIIQAIKDGEINYFDYSGKIIY